MHQMQNIFKSSAKPICIYMLMYMLLHVYTYINVNAYHRRGEKRSYEGLFPAPLNHSGFVEQTKKHEHFWSLRHCRKSKQETLEEVHPSHWCPVNLNHTDCILQPRSDEFWPMNWTPNPTTSKLIWQRNLERCRWVWRSQVQRWDRSREEHPTMQTPCCPACPRAKWASDTSSAGLGSRGVAKASCAWVLMQKLCWNISLTSFVLQLQAWHS